MKEDKLSTEHRDIFYRLKRSRHTAKFARKVQKLKVHFRHVLFTEHQKYVKLLTFLSSNKNSKKVSELLKTDFRVFWNI